MLLPLSSTCFHSCPASPLLSYISQPTAPSPSSFSSTAPLIETLSKLLRRSSQKQKTADPVRLRPATATTTSAFSTDHSTPTPITINRSAPVNVPVANVWSVVGSYPPDQTNDLSTKTNQRTCTNPRTPFARELDDNARPLCFLQAPNTLEANSNHIQLAHPSRTVRSTVSTSNCSFPPDPVPLATFSYHGIPFVDDLQLEDEDDEVEQHHEKSDRTMGYLPLRRTTELAGRHQFAIGSAHSPLSPNSSRLFSPSLSPSTFFATTIPAAVHLLIARRNLPSPLYESVQKCHEALTSGFRSPVKHTPPSPTDDQDPPPRSQVRGIRSNSAQYLMRATETRMILARKLAAPLKMRAALPRRRVSFTPCGSHLAATVRQNLSE